MEGSRLKKKIWNGLRTAKGFARKIFGHKIVNEVLGFMLILGILYFGISGVLILALRTDTYWMAVISDSMKHTDESWKLYFTERGYDVSNFPLQGGFERGDMLIIEGASSVADVAIGDIIIFDTGLSEIPVVHRVVEIWEENGEGRFATKGDGNWVQLQFEKSIKPEQIRGKVAFVIPEIGHIALWFQGV